MNQDMSNTGELMDDNERLQMALCTLANNIGSSDMCILRLILLDFFSIVKTSALEYFTELQNCEEINIKDVSIVYEILLLMGKRTLWTEFRRTLADDKGNGHDHAYDVEKNSAHFSDFRRTMIKIGKQFTGKVDSLLMMYSIPNDITSIWMALIYLEDKRKVNIAEKTSLLKFKKKLTVAGSPQAGWIIQEYVERNFSSQSQSVSEQIHRDSESRKPINSEKIVERNFSSQSQAVSEQIHTDSESRKQINSEKIAERNLSSQNKTTEQMNSEPESRKPINAKGKRRSFEIDYLTIEVKKRQQRIETMKKQVCDSTEDCCSTIKQTGEQLKQKINFCVSTQIEDLEKKKTYKMKELDKMARDLETLSQQIEEMRKTLKQEMPSYETLSIEKIEESLSEVYPEVHGYFNINNKNISKDKSKFKDNISKYYVDYKPVDPDKCSVNFSDLNNRCFNINDTIRLEVVLKDSQDKHVSEEHESAPVKVCAQLQGDFENLKSNSNYEFSKIPSQKFPTFEFKLTNTGLWKLCVFVCGEMVPKPINIKILSDEGLKKIIPLNTDEFKSGPIFDVCFTTNGNYKYLLACNFTDTIFSFSTKGLRLFSVGDNKKIANLCSINDGCVFLTETTEKEIVVLDHKFNVKDQFGKDDFKDGSPQGIAATCKHGAVHVFVSDNISKCVQYYVNQVHIDTIVNLPTPDKRTITPWFLDVNKNLQLFICNNKRTVTSATDQKCSNKKNICYVEIVDMNSKTLVNSLKCDSAVCIDEQCNVFLGMNIGVKMFNSNLEFIKEFACNCDGSYGLSAFKGCLAVVFPGSIKFYRY